MTATKKVASAILALRGNEVCDPDYQQIAKELFDPEVYQLMPKGLEDLVLDHLKQAVKFIYDQKKLTMVLVGPNYYQFFRRQKILTKEEAYKCLPLGHAVRPVGVVFILEKDHPLLLVARERGFTIWENMTKGQLNRIETNTGQGALSAQASDGIKTRMLDGLRTRIPEAKPLPDGEA